MLNVYMEHPVETKLNSDLLTYHYHSYYIIANNVGHFVGLLRSGGEHLLVLKDKVNIGSQLIMLLRKVG